MDLKNGYKVIYNKVVDAAYHLYGTKALPAAGDNAMTYRDNAGATVDTTAMAYFTEKDGSIVGVKKSDGSEVKILVYCGSDLVLGEAETVTITVSTFSVGANCSVVITDELGHAFEVTKANDTFKLNKGMKIFVTPSAATGYHLSTTTLKLGSTSLTKDGDVYKTAAVSADAELKITLAATAD